MLALFACVACCIFYSGSWPSLIVIASFASDHFLCFLSIIRSPLFWKYVHVFLYQYNSCLLKVRIQCVMHWARHLIYVSWKTNPPLIQPSQVSIFFLCFYNYDFLKISFTLLKSAFSLPNLFLLACFLSANIASVLCITQSQNVGCDWFP